MVDYTSPPRPHFIYKFTSGYINVYEVIWYMTSDL